MDRMRRISKYLKGSLSKRERKIARQRGGARVKEIEREKGRKNMVA